MDDRNIGVVGLGNMGGRIARRIHDAGHWLVGYDRDTSKARATGLAVAPSVAALVEQADCILLSLPDSAAVEAVVAGDGGILSCSRSGQVVIDLSTSRPSSSVRLHGELATRGVEFVDAGISGGAAAAEKGVLTIMAGGSRQVLQDLEWLFPAFSTKVAYMGEIGTGHTAKILNNFLNGVSLSATAEAMVAARKAGLDLRTFLDVLNSSSGVNFATLNRFPAIIEGDYLEGGLTGELMMKDLVLYVERLQELGISSLNASGPVATFGLSNHLGYGNQISNRVVDAVGDAAGGVRLQPERERAE